MSLVLSVTTIHLTNHVSSANSCLLLVHTLSLSCAFFSNLSISAYLLYFSRCLAGNEGKKCGDYANGRDLAAAVVVVVESSA
jgi:hypothetical protein